MTGIVVGVDGSDASSRALARAAQEARLAGQPLRVVHAWTTPVWMGGVPGFAYNALASDEESCAFAQELLGRQLEALRGGGDVGDLSVTSSAVEGSAREVLVAE